MRILALSEFDPALLLTGHRCAMRALGHDYRLAVMDVYKHGETGHDWWIAKPGRPSEALGKIIDIGNFAAEADIIQYHPAIGQPWAYETLHPVLIDGEDLPVGAFPVPFPALGGPKTRKISFFAGSRNAAAGDNAERYAQHWRGRGHAIWTNSLEYVDRMAATFAPPILYPPDGAAEWPRAPLRGDDDPLIVAHTPTDRINCQTPTFLAIAQRLGVVVSMVEGRPARESIACKARAHAVFDHLRGAYSINTLEACAVGAVPLVGMTLPSIHALERGLGCDVRPFTPIVQSADGLENKMRMLRDYPAATRLRQEDARRWFNESMSPAALGPRLGRLYEEVISCPT